MAELNFGELANTIRNTVAQAQNYVPLFENAETAVRDAATQKRAMDHMNTAPRMVNPDTRPDQPALVPMKIGSYELNIDNNASDLTENTKRYSLSPQASQLLRTPGAYDDYMNKKDSFNRMIGRWEIEDSPEERAKIINEFSDTFSLRQNKMLDYMINELSVYDEEDSKKYGTDKDETPENRILNRAKKANEMTSWANQIVKRYNPYRNA